LVITEVFDPAAPTVAIPLTVNTPVTLTDGTVVTLKPDGTLDITPGTGVTSVDLDYTLEDEDGLTDVGNVTVTVNQPPVADDDTAVTDPGTLVNVNALDGDNDPDGDNANLVITEVFDPVAPTVAISLTVNTPVTLTDGTVVTLKPDGTLDITPGTGVTSVDLDYTLEDEDGLTDVGNVAVTVNQPPVADDDTAVTNPGTLVNINALDGDNDPDGDNANLVITEVFDPAAPTVAIPLTVNTPVTLIDGTVVTLLPNGTLDITPGTGVTSVDLDYTLEDEDGLTDVGNVAVTVNQPPVADDDTAVTDPGTLVNINALDGDNDPDGDNANLVITEVFDPAAPTVAIPLTVNTPVTLTDGTVVTLKPDGTLDITPGTGVTSVDLDYTLEDEDGLTDVGNVAVTVNQPPVADDDTAVTNPGTLVNINALDGDNDPDGDNANLVITEVFDPVAPTVAISLTVNTPVTLTDGTVVTLKPDGTLDITPGTGVTSVDLDYTLEDEDGLTDVGNVIVTVNQPPVADDETVANATINTAVLVDALDGDNDPDGDNVNLVITEVDGAPISDGNPVTLADGSVVTLLPDGTLSVTPVTDSTEPISFVYTVEDEDGLEDEGQVDITFDQLPPVADDDTVLEAVVNTPIPVDTLDGDIDPDGDNTNLVITEVDGTPISNGNPVTLADGSVVTLLPDGTLNVTPPTDSIQPISFVYTVEDEDGLEDEGQVDITFSPCPFPMDTDNDGLTDCEETTGIDDPSTPLDPLGTTTDPNDACDPIASSPLTDADGDGLTDCEETTGLDNPNTPEDPAGATSNPNDACDPISSNCFPVANNDGGTTDPGEDIII
ncbi:Ig-like domain-containing protein, partial [Algibacter amylolyticus]|uniref:Ig-like domain-containing protein n=1 Tax=Algibacter amylolyticus TaxID=1608400 RepID=UPI0017CAF5B5